MWLELSNKLLTWEMLKKRGFEGPSIYSLCKMNEETISHLFSLCPYAGSVWIGVTRTLSNKGTHEIQTATLEECTKSWLQDEAVGLYEAFPVLFVYSIWEAQNRTI